MTELERIRDIVRGRKHERIYPSSREYAVLVPLILQDGELHLLFEVRQAEIRQGGEICFPGGEIESGENGQQAAVRETAEELLIAPDTIEILAPMYEVMGPGGVKILSYLGLLKNYCGSFSEREVDHIFTVPLSWFAENPAEVYRGNRLRIEVGEDFPAELIPGGLQYPFRTIPRQQYFYRTDGGVIWGMTAELLFHCLQLLKVSPGAEEISAGKKVLAEAAEISSGKKEEQRPGSAPEGTPA